MTQCSRIFRREFSKQYLGFCVENPNDFFLFCWWPYHNRLSRFAFVTYRVLLMVYALYWYVDIMVLAHSFFNGEHYIMAYLTIWSYLLICVYLCWAALVAAVRLATDWHALQQPSRFSPPSVVAQRDAKVQRSEAAVATIELVSERVATNGTNGRSEASESTPSVLSFGQGALLLRVPWYSALQWLLYSVLQCVAPLITLCYWIILFPQINKGTDASDVHVHAVNTVLVWIELSLVAMPVRLCHVLYAFCYCICYLIFSVVYWAVDHGNVVYGDLMNWNKPLLAVGFVLMLLGVLAVVQLTAFGLYLLRAALCRRCLARRHVPHMTDGF